MRFKPSVIGVLFAVALGGCQYSPDLVDRAIAYNKAIAQSTNEMLLLNMLRARDREPTYYTRSTSDTATTAINPALSLSAPFGPLNHGATRASLSGVLGGSVQSQLALQNLDDQNFMRGILTPISTKVLGFYLREGWPKEVLFMTTIARIKISRGALDRLVKAFNEDCSQNASANYCDGQVPLSLRRGHSYASQYVAQQVQSCESNGGTLIAKSFGLHPKGLTYIFDNYPTDHAQVACFQWMMRLIIAVGPHAVKAESLELVSRNLPQTPAFSPSAVAKLSTSKLVLSVGPNHTFDVCKTIKITALELSDLPAQAQLTVGRPKDGLTPVSANADKQKLSCAALARSAPPARNPFSVQLTTRSFDGMVYYLGEVLREQEDSGQKTTVWTWNGRKNRYAIWNLFVATTHSTLRSAVSVRYDGRTYRIPVSCNDTEICTNPQRKHRSLQVLALLSQIWGLEKQESQMPIVPTVTVVNP